MKLFTFHLFEQWNPYLEHQLKMNESNILIPIRFKIWSILQIVVSGQSLGILPYVTSDNNSGIRDANIMHIHSINSSREIK